MAREREIKRNRVRERDSKKETKIINYSLLRRNLNIMAKGPLTQRIFTEKKNNIIIIKSCWVAMNVCYCPY